MKIYLFSFIVVALIACAEKPKPEDFDLETQFEKSEGTQTPEYADVISYYKQLDSAYVAIKTYEIGETDSGFPLTLITYNPDRSLESEFSENKNALRVLINNGIHPGEPDGIDATMMMMRDLASGKIKTPENIWVGAIAVYNVGGALNRNNTSRTNQNGPEEYGFRGNARNYDLNRDFIKADTKNARSFAEVYHLINPDVFIDNHVSNGADYQYVLTHLFTQHNKLGGKLGAYLNTEMHPQLEKELEANGWPITPYVNVFNEVPETGFSQFMDYPRYSTGYTTLWNTLGMMVETHMLKPYKPRVEGTYELMKAMLNIASKDAARIKKMRFEIDSLYKSGNYSGKHYVTNFTIDSSRTTMFDFKGFEGKQITSTVTGLDRLKYDREAPFSKEVTYYNYIKPTDSITIPKMYIVPQAYSDIITRLRENKIRYTTIKKDTSMAVTVYHIADYSTRSTPYEGHYLHSATQVDKSTENINFRKGDYLVETAQSGLRYLLETLEPTAVDSFFNWNYFDTILQQKEGFSPYVWEDKAQELLDGNPDLKQEFETKKQVDKDFSKNWYAQLEWLHKKSPNYEKAHLRYPIFRVE
ncbi:M14 family metallopeptidase [Leeuwenhoekiella sp. W20_SRS_FM14]|uniref:M14 family metallopeptidase n=1 Tax=Leeuwenhoekiella sp. W20_SRS_FM14 TaxID=3240270 RepID=UPI003F994551